MSIKENNDVRPEGSYLEAPTSRGAGGHTLIQRKSMKKDTIEV